MQTLAKGSVHIIRDVTNQNNVQVVGDNSGNIYILSAPSPDGFTHAEQRLIEFRDIVHAYKADPKAWVAGKKRPCFGCWIREILTNKKGVYQLVYQDQPGKGFMGTYLAAPPKEKERWVKELEDPEMTVFESKPGGGEIGPESDSEAESEIDYSVYEELVEDIAKKKLTPNKRKSIEFHLKKAKVDYATVENYGAKKKRKKEEDAYIEASRKKLKTYSESSSNPGVKEMFNFTSMKK